MNSTDRILGKIEETRSKNNRNWMALLRLAFRYTPNEAKMIMKNITKCDQEISKLCEELTK